MLHLVATAHACQRARQRLRWHARTLERMLARVFYLGVSAEDCSRHPAPLDIKKEQTNQKHGVSGKNPPSQLKRFKKVARKLSFADIPWSLRYLLDRADRLHNEELRKLRDECRIRTQALKADEKEFLNSGIVPPSADPAV